MEIGQKSRCPVCDSKKAAEPKSQPAAPPASPETASADFSREELAKIDEFVKAHPKDWNDEFDDFYDKNVLAAGYKETVLKCRHRAEIFDSVRELIKDAKTLSADLMIRIMEEIPKKYPEIEEYQARTLAKEFFAGCIQNRTLQLTLKLTLREALADDKLLRCTFEEFFQKKQTGITFSWYCSRNDMVDADAALGCINETEMIRVWNAVWTSFYPWLTKEDFARPVVVKSPMHGKITSIRTQVHHLDNVICEIETEN